MASGMAAVLPSQGVAGGKLYATHKNGFDFLIALFGAEGGVLATIEGRVPHGACGRPPPPVSPCAT